MRIAVAPTLARMAAVYALPRDGGAASPRFRAYVQAAATDWGLSAFNPMAGAHAAATVQALVALDAEGVAAAAAAAVETLAEARSLPATTPAPLRLALAVLSPGLWTERVTADSLHRTHGMGGWHRGLVPVWSREPMTARDVRHVTAREAARLLWDATHGPARSVRAVLAREGTALVVADAVLASLHRVTADSAAAIAMPTDDPGSMASGGTPAPDPAVSDALTILGESHATADAVAVLLGDDAAAAHGWSGLGIGAGAGERHAHWQARQAAHRHGIPALLRDGTAGWLLASP
ncbi:MAG: hypothetical protein KJT01_12240 [Gemmatimonadetes bacterium]|nr:hypothetical protein [Gemmatimonadota bacterium]